MTKTLVIWVQGFEKMISGMYLGDIMRRVILRMSLESDMFGPISSKLLTPFVLRFVPILSHALCMSNIFRKTYLILRLDVSCYSIKRQSGKTKHLLGKGQTYCCSIVGSFILVIQSIGKGKFYTYNFFKILHYFSTLMCIYIYLVIWSQPTLIFIRHWIFLFFYHTPFIN